MSGSWNQGYQSAPAPVNHAGRPPICFNCGLEGHYLINCPKPRRTPGIVTAPPPNIQQQYPPPTPPPQAFPQQTAPVQTPYQQYPQSQQYGPPSMQPQYGYDQPPPQQAYNQGPPIPPYGNAPYQAPPNNQYPNNGGYSQYGPQSSSPQQYSAPQYGATQQPISQYSAQQYGPPQSAPSYQPPTPMYQPAQSPNGYNGNYAQPPSNFQGPPQQQWNNMPPPPITRNAPPYQRQQRGYSDSSSASGTPGFQGQQPQQPYPSDAFHGRNGSRSSQQTAQPSMASNTLSQQPTPNSVHTVPTASRPQAVPSNVASMSFSQSETTTISGQKHAISESSGNKNQSVASFSKDDDDLEQLTEDQQFEWDMAWIFMSVPPKETVQLSQPLPLDFATPPVPLQVKTFTQSISRYARNDNRLEFVKHIQKTPHWALFKDDPAFAPIDIYAELIPVDRIIHWTMERHGLIEQEDTPPSSTRKRPRLENIQEVVDGRHKEKNARTEVETAIKPESDGPPSKRQKNEQQNEDSLEKPGTPVITTPVYTARNGTPCLPTDDEAWMPQPGEGAASVPSPDDPMEELLASLGVTGAPKPVVEQPLPPYNPPTDDVVSDIAQAPSELPKNKTPVHVPPINTQQNVFTTSSSYTNGRSHRGPHVGTPHASIPDSQNQPSQFGPPANPPYQNGQQFQSQQAPIHPTYQNVGPQDATYGNPQYGFPNQQPYNNIINPQQSPNTPYGPPVNGDCYNGAPVNQPYSVPQNQQPLYGPGPQQNNNYNAPQPYDQPVNYNSGPSNNYVDGINGNAQYQQAPEQPQYGPTPTQNAPFRQDSGYGSAGGSFSNSASQPNFPQQASNSQQMPPPNGKPPRHDTHNGTPKSDNIPSPYGNHESVNKNSDSAEKMVRSNSMDDGQDGSPLSPMSQEILGKLSQPSRKSSLGSRKRPAPVVDEAYSRRW